MKKISKNVSYNMSRIFCKGTAIEKLMSAWLMHMAIRGYKKNSSSVFGKPDFSWQKQKIAVFCDSSFWHGYKKMKTARHNFKSNKKFWRNKISRNITRDKEVNRELKRQSWEVLRFWDFQIRGDIDKCISRIKQALRKRQK